MYYLDQKKVVPLIILFGIILFPSTIFAILGTIFNFSIVIFIVLCVLLLIWLMVISGLSDTSKRKDHYLLLGKEDVKIVFRDIDDRTIKIELSFEQIKKFTYYRITSIAGWLILHSFILPKSVFLTYNINGEEYTKFIGYLNTKDVKEIAKIVNAELKLY